MDTVLGAQTADLVALGRRARWALGFRLLLGSCPLLVWWVLPTLRSGRLPDVLAAAAGYLVAVAVLDLVRRTGRRAALWSIGASLLLDGVFLAWALRDTGGLDGPLGNVLVVHATAITLLASFRSGVKIALWDSLVLVCVLEADSDGTLGTSLLGDTFPTARLAVLLSTIWSATLVTAAFASVNERELRRRRYDMQVLRQFGLDLEDSYDLQDIAVRLTVLCRDELLARRVVVLIDPAASDPPDPAGPRAAGERSAVLVCATADGLQVATPPERLHPGSVVLQAAAEHRALLRGAPSAVGDEWLEALVPRARNLVVVPFQARGRVQGAVVLEYGEDRRWRAPGVERRTVSTAEQAASHAALAAGRAHLVHRMRLAAEVDGLTGIANRRTFDAALREELQRPREPGQPGCSVVLLDLDHFKQVNDRHGHLVGDEVLKGLAACLRASARPGDTPARYGGEEFALVLPRTAPHEALLVAERVRAAVEAMDGPVPVTASLGVAGDPLHGDDALTLLSAADAALYLAKSSGRNRAVVAGVPRSDLVPSP